ncbi:MAG TPA: cytochrome c peroxidase [Nevskiaceae bacterium]|nr:cytochrome c peroxidase [Nevskiaceae bacterium]
MRKFILLGLPLVLAACGGGNALGSANPQVPTQAGVSGTPPPQGQQPPPPPPPPPQQQPPPPPPAADLDQQLRAIIQAQGLTGDPSRGRDVPDISSPLAQLGMRLFFSRSLSGDADVACASCHLPTLAGADQLSMPVGVAADDPSLIGPGRSNAADQPIVPRNAPTTFNAVLWDHFMFDDGRIESLRPQPGANGAAGQIRTPDVPFAQPDPEAGSTLPAAQSRFPVTVDAEMRGAMFEAGNGNDDVRNHLAARIGNYGAGKGELKRDRWLPLFQAAFNVSTGARSVITYPNIAEALATYERSQLFVDNPWRDYVGGNNAAIPDAAKRGAIAFLTPGNRGGAGCSRCHRGDAFTDEQFHVIGVPQIGVGKGDGAHGDDDFGRGRESGDANDRYAYRTPSLLNVALTAPYDHDGVFATLDRVVQHYRNPAQSATGYVNGRQWCALRQFQQLPLAQCQALYPDAAANTQAALNQLNAQRGTPRGLPPTNISNQQAADIVAFLQTLSSRCAADRNCAARWTPPRDGGPDGQQLAPVDQHGNPL